MTANARFVDVAIAAVAALNAGPAQSGFSQTFTATRAWRPAFDLVSIKAGLKVTVIPRTMVETAFMRNTVKADAEINVWVQNFVTSDDDSDALALLVQEIVSVLDKGLTLTDGATDCGWLQTIYEDPFPIPDHLQNLSVFSGPVNLQYQTRRAR